MKSTSTHILGISAFYHDSAACLLRDGAIVAAVQEERFSRRKNDGRFPTRSIAYCLDAAGIVAAELDAVSFYDKPVLTFGRLLQSYLENPLRSYASFRRSLPLWVNEKLRIPRIIDDALEGFRGDIYFHRHHESHAASAFFCSPFEEAATLVVDGVGEWACTSIGRGAANAIELLCEVQFPHSLGLFYSAATQYLGFKVNLDEYKVMGLAPYGEPHYSQRLLDNLIDLKMDGSLALNLDYFDFVHGLRMANERWSVLFGHAQRREGAPLDQFHMDFAASVQEITSEAMVRLARTAHAMTGLQNLCLAGGVALNCVANGAIYRSGIFDNIYVQPAAGDAGGAIGAALQAWHQKLGNPRTVPIQELMADACLGPDISNVEVVAFLQANGATYHEMLEHELTAAIARWIDEGKLVGLCRGRLEFGPRALGARSILGDPREPDSQARINMRVKYRESFRPFAPAVLEERVSDYFDIDIPSPYMLLVMPVRDSRRRHVEENACRNGLDKLRIVRSDVPAVTHVDYSVRLQTVTPQRNGFFYDIVAAFYERTGCPMIVNTSFNLRGEPIVADHIDAYHAFLMSDLDIVVLGDCVVAKPGVMLDSGSLVSERGGD